MQADLIRNVSDSIERAAEALPALAGPAGFALRTIAASSGRASLQEKRLSASARLSIASAAMSFAAAALASGGRHAALHIAPVIRSAVALKAGPARPEHAEGSDEEAPEGWGGETGGPFVADAVGGASLSLTRRPHLPGGDWTVHIDGLPLAFGRTAAEAAERGMALAELVATASRKVPPVPARLGGRRKR